MKMRLFRLMLVFTLVCSGCGMAGGVANKTDENTVIDENGKAEETSEVLDEKKEQSVTITAIRRNSEIKTVCVEAVVSSETKPKVSDYALNGIQEYRIDISRGNGGYLIKWYGFYKEEDAIKNPEVVYHLQQKLENVCNEAKVDEVEMRSFKVSVGKHEIPVYLTSFSVVIKPEESWAKDDRAYDFFAQNKEGEVLYMCTLFAEDMKRSKKKEIILNPDEAEELGKGYPAGKILEHSGMEYAMYEEIDIHDIQKVYCKERH